jgi:hypothetical protein
VRLDCVAKPADVLLADHIRHFAYNGEPSHPLLDARARVELRHGTLKLLQDPTKLAEFQALVAGLNSQKKRFRQSVQELARETRSQFLADARQKGVCCFEQFFEEEAAAVASSFTEYVGLKEQCLARPLDQLLRIESIRMAVGLSLSYVWAVNFEGRGAKPSDGSDFQHAICAAGAGADIFVTHDNDLVPRARRVAIPGFRVMALQQLLALLVDQRC